MFCTLVPYYWTDIGSGDSGHSNPRSNHSTRTGFLLQLHLIGALLLTLELVEELASILVWALRNSCVGGGEECFLLLGFLVLIWEINVVVVVT